MNTNNQNTVAVVLAAGKSKRMNSDFSKVLHKIYGKTMLEYVLDAVTNCGIKRILAVTNGQKEISALCKEKNIDIVIQRKLLGTANAVKQTEKVLRSFKGNVLIVYGDTPLITSATLSKLLEKHYSGNYACTFITTFMENPMGYGRIVRDDKDNIMKIVEEVDASRYEKAIKEINAGIYIFRKKDLFNIINKIKRDSITKEYYLTHAIKLLYRLGKRTESVIIDNDDELIGVNSREELAKAHNFIKNRILKVLLENGVGIIDPLTTHIYNDVKIGKDTIIYPFTFIESDVNIGKRCRIGPFSFVGVNTRISDEVKISNFVKIKNSKIGEGSIIGNNSSVINSKLPKNTILKPGSFLNKPSNKE